MEKVEGVHCFKVYITDFMSFRRKIEGTPPWCKSERGQVRAFICGLLAKEFSFLRLNL
jgi:hypothetical protein